jgi:hypothetical protein
MTTIESYYLAVCVTAITVFAITLAYNTASWKSWKLSRDVKNVAPGSAARVKPETKLAT